MIDSPLWRTSCAVLAGLAGAVAAAGWWLPAGTDVTAGASVLPSRVAVATPAATDDGASVVDAVVSQNLFSATRSAPATRWTPPGLETPPMPADQPVLDSVASLPMAGDSTMADAVPALYGTVIGDAAPRALLRLADDDVAPRLYRVGDRHGGWRVVSIARDRVVLAGAGGSRTLQLLSTPEPR